MTVYAANAADLARMREVVDDIERRWGPLTGIIHLAGVTGASALAPVADLSADDFAAHLEPKVDGVSVLRELARGRRLDFCVTFSSTASILGGVGMLPYAAANAFLDSVAVAAPAASRWISINWDGWLTSDTTPLQGTALARYALAPDRAVRLFGQILASTISGQVVVSTAPLQPRIEEWTTAARPRSAARPELIADYVAPRTPLETEVAGVWARVLGLGRVGVHDNLFELGGNSLIALRLVAQLTRVTGVTVPATVVFEAPTVRTLAAWIQAQRAPVPAAAPVQDRPTQTERREEADGIAIIGMAGRFPGADSVAEFWQRLVRGEDCIQRQAVGDDAPDFVRATAALSDYECFDAAFFGMPPAEAMLRDPQHRILLEQAWAALEDAGYDCRRSPHRVGVFAGATTNTYLTHHIARRPDVMAAFDPVQINVANGPDFLTTLVSYKLNLTGPSHTVQSACSTSLVAVHTACRSLIDGECDMALAGGVSVNLAIVDGYRHVAGGILSADGFVRAFDAQATGTVFGSGVGVVVLKRLADARRDGDSIRAIIRGSAVNNDGALKAGYTTPSVDGEARVIEEALRAARVDPRTVSYVECHGTGTTLGDPIELRALAKAYLHGCAIGSVKTNVGHLDAAAGVAGLIKVVESLRHGTLVPSLYYQSPNPQIDLTSTPCLVNTTRREWPRADGPRRAGVSAFGVGGTNAHVIVEEAPAPQASGAGRSWQLIVWSARTIEALDTIAQRLASHLRQHTDVSLADAAYTLQVGRHRLPWRRAIVCREREEALDALEAGFVDARRDGSTDDAGPVLFVIPGEGAPRPGAGRDLYESERIYREQIDRAAAVLEAEYGLDIKDVLIEADRMADGRFAPPVLVATAYALAKVWESWGVRPAALLGHGVGEYAVAALSGVLTLEQALRLAAARGRVHEAGRDEAAFVDAVSRVTWGAIGVPYVSSVTGTWITEVDVRSTEYWRRHLRGPLQNGRALDTLRGDGAGVVLEIAPSDLRARLQTLAGLWAAGVDIDWPGFAADERRHRVPLPSYPFQRTRHWIDPPTIAAPEAPAPAPRPVAITSNRPALRNPYVAPRGQLEASIVGIVEAALGIHPIGVTDRFGELGGDSLQAVRIIDAINTRLGCHLRAIDLYEEATVRALVERLAPEHPEGARYERDRSGDRVGERAQGVSE